MLKGRGSAGVPSKYNKKAKPAPEAAPAKQMKAKPAPKASPKQVTQKKAVAAKPKKQKSPSVSSEEASDDQFEQGSMESFDEDDSMMDDDFSGTAAGKKKCVAEPRCRGSA